MISRWLVTYFRVRASQPKSHYGLELETQWEEFVQQFDKELDPLWASLDANPEHDFNR